MHTLNTTHSAFQTLQQLPWGLDCTQFVVRGVGAAAPPLNYNGAATIWDLHDQFEHKLGVAVAMAGMTVHDVIPASHLWPRDREPHPSEAVQVAVPAGAALITLASTWHSAPPVLESPSAVLRLGYNASLLRSEENMFVSNVRLHPATPPMLWSCAGRRGSGC